MDPRLIYMLGFIVTLLVILIVSFNSRARVFSQYLTLMTAVRLKPGEIKKIYKLRGKPGVRELFLDLIIREDLKDSPPITPDTPGEKPVTELLNK